MDAWIMDMILGNPAVQSVLVVVVSWFVGGKTFVAALEGIALALKPFILMTPTKQDDKWLEIIIYWLDAVGDLIDPLSELKFRKFYKVWKRIQGDLGKPYSKRRRD